MLSHTVPLSQLRRKHPVRPLQCLTQLPFRKKLFDLPQIPPPDPPQVLTRIGPNSPASTETQ